MNTTPTKQLPSLEEFKLQAKELKKSENFEKLGHAQNALAKKYGYKDYRAIKSVLKSDVLKNKDAQHSEVMDASEFKCLIKEQTFSNNNPTLHFKKKHYFKNQKNIIDGIAIDPVIPKKFWSMAHDRREQIELDEWWERPFIVTQGFFHESYDAYCARVKPHYDELAMLHPEEKHTHRVQTQEEFNARVEDEKKSWYDAWPTGIRYDVYILDGGYWDGPTPKSKVDGLEKAIAIAKELEADN